MKNTKSRITIYTPEQMIVNQSIVSGIKTVLDGYKYKFNVKRLEKALRSHFNAKLMDEIKIEKTDGYYTDEDGYPLTRIVKSVGRGSNTNSKEYVLYIMGRYLFHFFVKSRDDEGWRKEIIHLTDVFDTMDEQQWYVGVRSIENKLASLSKKVFSARKEAMDIIRALPSPSHNGNRLERYGQTPDAMTEKAYPELFQHLRGEDEYNG